MKAKGKKSHVSHILIVYNWRAIKDKVVLISLNVLKCSKSAFFYIANLDYIIDYHVQI